EARVAQRTAELQRQQQQTEAILQSSSDGIVLLDENLKIRSTNESFCALFRCSQASCLGTSLLQNIHPNDQSLLREQLNATKRDESNRRCEVRALRPDGQIRHLDIGISRVRQMNGEAPNLVCTIRDVTVRKRAEEQLLESEERLRTIVENIPVMISFFDTEGRFAFVNQCWLDQVGWTVEDLRAADDPLSLFYPDPEYRQQVLDFMLSTETGWRDFRSQTKYRGERITSWANVRLSDGRSIGIGQDITERKQAQVALQQSEARYRSLFEQSTDGVFILDLEGNHLAVNQHAAEMLGYTLDEMKDFSFRDVTVPEEYSKGERVLERLLDGEQIAIYERKVRRRDGMIFPVEINVELVRDEQGQPLHIQSLMRDISERKQAELALRASEHKFRSLIETMHSGFAMYDEADRFIYVNPQLCEILGYEMHELLGSVASDFVDAAYQQRTAEELRRRQNGETGNYEIVAQRKDGQSVHLLISATPMMDDEGNFNGSSAVVTNITPLKQAQEHALELARRLQLATEAGGVGVWEWDVQHNSIVWDQQMYKLYGIQPEDAPQSLLDIWQSEIFHPDDQQRMLRENEQFLDTGTIFDSEFRIILPDKTIRHLRSKAIL
ncbi:MAG: PAS domain S-box protein, partial [Anaerolineae bacterium]|nr:PAS domain S-box protein [Anaerolineae bacterium]